MTIEYTYNPEPPNLITRINVQAKLTGTYFYLACLQLLLLVTAGCSATGHSQQEIPNQVQVELLYMTDRNIINTGQFETFYGIERGNVSYGLCTVAINPKENTKSSYANYKAWNAGNNILDEPAQIIQIDPLEETAFFNQLAKKINQGNDKSALLFIHGYARSFETAAIITATLTYEMNYQGTPILYSWPSRNNAAAYISDVTTIDWATLHLQQFIKKLAEQNDLNTIHVLAHSLGNRAFLNAFTNILKNHSPEDTWKFGEIVLVAPDVDRSIFERDIIPVINNTPSRVTLYISSVDIPLIASQSFNLYPRVGDGRHSPIITKGIETIDATPAAGIFIGHSYYRNSPEVLTDLNFLINNRAGADNRPTLMPIDSTNGHYWQVIANQPQESDEIN